MFLQFTMNFRNNKSVIGLLQTVRYCRKKQRLELKPVCNQWSYYHRFAYGFEKFKDHSSGMTLLCHDPQKRLVHWLSRDSSFASFVLDDMCDKP